MKSFKIVILIFIGLVVLLVLLTYPTYRSEMNSSKKRILESKLFETRDGIIEYKVEGEGIPILVLHGAGGGFDQGLWISRMIFDKKYKIISVSRFGYLRSNIPDNASIKTQALLYKDLLDYLKINKVIVVGNSAGGPSAMQFVKDYPERSLALMLLSAVSKVGPANNKFSFQVQTVRLIQRFDYIYWLFAKFFQSYFLNLIGIPTNVYKNFNTEQKKMAQDLLDVMHPVTLRNKGTFNDIKMIRKVIGLEIRKNSIPTLIIHARDDKLVGFSNAENSQKMINGSILISFEIGGHAMLSQMENVRKNIDDFLSRALNKLY